MVKGVKVKAQARVEKAQVKVMVNAKLKEKEVKEKVVDSKAHAIIVV